MTWRNVCWWIVFTFFAILLQARFPGLDFLLPGFILAIQERNPVQFGWVALFYLLLQEGMGNMAFGGTLLWYSMAVAFFFVGYRLFEVESFLFIFLLSGCLGVTHYAVSLLMAGLQDVPVRPQELMDDSVFQALLTPCLWRLAYFTRGILPHEDRS